MELLKKRIELKKRVIALWCFFLGSLILIFAFYSYPVPSGDSEFFLVPAVQFRAHGELTSPVFPAEWEIDDIIDPTGARRFLFYPPLFPLVVSFLMPVATADGTFFALAFINTLIIIAGAFLFYKTANEKGELTWQSVLIIIVSLVALAASFAETGRPEALARMWVALAMIVPFYFSAKQESDTKVSINAEAGFQKQKKYIPIIIFGILLGLMFATNPFAGVISICILGIYFGTTLKPKELFFFGVGLLFVGAVVALGVIAAGPFGIGETIRGTYLNAVVIDHAIKSLGNPMFTVQNIIQRYITSAVAPFYGLVMIILLVTALVWFKKSRTRLASPFVVFASMMALLFLIAKTTYSYGHVSYITLFSPLIFCIFLSIFLGGKKIIKGIILVTLLLTATGFLRTTLLFPAFVNQSATLQEARGVFAETRREYEGAGNIGVTGGLWTLTEDYRNMYSYARGEKVKENTGFIFFQQRYSGLLSPPEILGCQLREDKFSREIPQFFGIKLGNTMPGYGYAVYDCLPSNL